MKEDLAISQVVSRLLLVFMAAGVAVLTCGYFLVSAHLIDGSVKARAHMLAGLVEEKTHNQGAAGAAALKKRLEQALVHDANHSEWRHLYGANDELLAMQGKAGLRPFVSHSIWIREAGTPIARLEVSRSLRPLVYESLMVAGGLSSAAGLFYLFMSMVPLRKLRTVEQQIRSQAITDRLTGLYNRHGFYCCLDQEMARAERFLVPLALISIDVDHFKRINDAHGHAVGDDVLKELARHLRTRVRAMDKLVRWGGEELQILAPETNLIGAGMLAEKVRMEVDTHKFPGVGRVTVSAGVTVFKPGEHADEFIARADRALYKAKTDGRNRVVSLAPQVTERKRA